ncbi:MAG: hypothetical protein ACOYJL_03240 [Tractidigestivibacter sp.]|uniref:hypothetical protein n=1 Tax=Tractidigestivibacter sp. TaxID=2847320 RepID=UPI003D932B6F
MAHLSGSAAVSIQSMGDLLANNREALGALFSRQELDRAAKSSHAAQYLAGHLAAKRAVLMAAETIGPAGRDEFLPLDVVITNDALGAPRCTTVGMLSKALASLGADNPLVSITDESGIAMATAAIELGSAPEEIAHLMKGRS